jgi:8-oxo-dGTP pyrophosphatase MutT (NUDIX family)
MDADETDLQVALAREIKEELNLELTEISKMIWFDLSPKLSTFAVLLEVKVKSLEGLKLSSEHSEYRWIKPSDPQLLNLMFYKNLSRKVNEIYGIMQ